MLIPNLLGLPMEVLHTDMNVHFRRCQVLMAYPLLDHCRVTAPSVQRMADMGMAERMNRHVGFVGEGFHGTA